MTIGSKMLYVKFNEMQAVVTQILLKEGLCEHDAKLIAAVMAESSLDGIQSHGINRLPLFVEYLQKGIINSKAELKLVADRGIAKQFDGNYGLGIKNAILCTDEAINIARNNSIGFVTLRNTNHWHRAGTYGWRAIEKGFILICWTNTIPNLPPFGSPKNLIGNNPLCVAIPHSKTPIVLDMAMSQFSYGKIASAARNAEELPVIGGYDELGELTTNAKMIHEKGKHLPIGFWKGSNLAFVLDMLAAILSEGRTTRQIEEMQGYDTGMSQVFIAINPNSFSEQNFLENLMSETILTFAETNELEGTDIRYPGEETLKRRKQNLVSGIPVEEEIWLMIKALL